MDCSPPGSSAHGIFQARVLEWGAIAFSILMHIYMEFRKMVTMTNVRQKKKKDIDIKNRLLDSVGEGKGGMI